MYQNISNRNFSILSKLYRNRKKTRKTDSIKTDFDFGSENFDSINFDFDYRKFFNLDHVCPKPFCFDIFDLSILHSGIPPCRNRFSSSSVYHLSLEEIGSLPRLSCSLHYYAALPFCSLPRLSCSLHYYAALPFCSLPRPSCSLHYYAALPFCSAFVEGGWVNK